MSYSISTLISMEEIINRKQNETISMLTQEVNNQAFKLFSAQIKSLLDRGILKIKNPQILMSRMPDSDDIKMTQYFELELSNEEYVKKLEDENKELRESLNKLKELFTKEIQK